MSPSLSSPGQTNPGATCEPVKNADGEGAALGLLDVAGDVKAVAADLDGVAVVADLADPGATREAMADLVALLGGVDVLVNNAGILRIAPLLDISVDEWDVVFAVNTRSMLVTTQVAARSMIDAGHGGRGRPDPLGGDRARPARHHRQRHLPGDVLTEMGAASRTPEMVAAWSASSPLGRCADPADIARMALFLVSSDASYCTGQAFNVTGGMIMH